MHYVQVDDTEGNHSVAPIHYTEGLKVSNRKYYCQYDTESV